MLMFYWSILVFCSFGFGQEQQLESSSTGFSGFYEPDHHKSAEDFAAAWLVSKDRFMLAEKAINVAPNMAGVTFATVRNKCDNCHTLLARDYLDFMVEHLSSTSNQIPFGNKKIFGVAIDNLKHTADRLQNMRPRKGKDKRMKQTVGVLIFSPISFSVYATKEQFEIRHTFFQATFYSVYRYFPNVVVFVANEADAQAVRNMSLPFLDLLITPVPLDAKNRTTTLPRTALETIINGTKTHDPMWSWVKYLYFTEGDQILHMRSAKHIYDAVDNSGGMFAIVPHRMQTLPLRSTFTPELQDVWSEEHVQRHMPSATILEVESLSRTRGSCCDAGRRDYAKCGQHWWYTCPEFGLANFTSWLRIGKAGYTFPPSTEHKGVCEYSSTKKLCPLPPNCSHRVPLKSMRNNGQNISVGTDLCTEFPNVQRIGQFPQAPDY